MSDHYTLPFPPSANNLYPTRRGRRVLSEAGKAYHLAVLCAVRAARKTSIAGPVSLAILVYEPDRRRRDISNLVKVIEDGLTRAGAWGDDSQVADLHIARKGVDRERPRVDVVVTEITAHPGRQAGEG